MSSVICTRGPSTVKDKETIKRVWFSLDGIRCVEMARVNEQSEKEVVRSRRRPGEEGRCVKEDFVTRGSAREADTRSMSG